MGKNEAEGKNADEDANLFALSAAAPNQFVHIK